MAAEPGPVDTVPFTSAPRGAGRWLAKRTYAVPLVVAVTGHRDLVPAEIPHIRARVRDCLVKLRDDSPGRIVVVMTALAEGADRLVAEEALALDMPLSVVLPMSRELYEQDFASRQSLEQFARLCDAAMDLFELPLTQGNTVGLISGFGAGRARQYAQLGVFLCAHCHVLLALWDGKESDQLGGTSQVVRFHHHDVMPGYTPRSTASHVSLADDESDLVYHIVVSRDRPDGAPAAGLSPLEVAWLTRDDDHSRSAAMPERHAQVFARANEFSEDARRHADSIDKECYPLLTEADAAGLPPGLRDINQAFCAADWLAIHFQKRVLTTLRITHVCALLTGLAYVTYADIVSARLLLLAALGPMVVAYCISWLANHGAWHRKYLDYRTLAEGLRVQFYWAAAGVTSGNVTKFAHDNFLQMQDSELGWIRNVMRVAGTECDVSPNQDPGGVRFVVREWIGDEASGQLGYYGRKIKERLAQQKTTQRVVKLGLWASAIALTALLAIGQWIPQEVSNPVTYLMGCVLLLVGVRQSYAKSTAESELIKQYEFMHRIFGNARKRHDDADNDLDRRRILKILGDAALEEHAEWILMHRERAIDQKEAVRLG
jgi:hypothetical protein